MGEVRALLNSSAPPEAESAFPAGWWRRINWLGLDAVAVAVLWLHVFGRSFGTRIETAESVVLAAAVWVVYAGDRVLDGFCPAAGRPLQLRHLFAQRHRIPLIVAVVLVAAATVATGFLTLRAGVVLAGLRFSLLLGSYFACVWISRRQPQSLVAFTGLHAALISLFLHGLPDQAMVGATWRSLAALTIAGALIAGLRLGRNAVLPWTLCRKAFGGLLFAAGCALAPLAHLEEWDGFLRPPVLLFGLVCAWNSLGIRVWENTERPAKEDRILASIYPWLPGLTALAAIAEIPGSSPFFQPVLAACAVACALLASLHGMRRKWRPEVLSALADGAVLVCGAGALAALAFR